MILFLSNINMTNNIYDIDIGPFNTFIFINDDQQELYEYLPNNPNEIRLNKTNTI